MNDLKAIILAAGEGTRMKSKISKVLHNVLNKPMIQYSIDVAKNSGAEAITVVVGYKAEEVKYALENQQVKFALQSEQRGTGHAVMQAMDFIEDDKDILVLYGDTPLIAGDTLKKFVQLHKNAKNAVSVISAVVDDPTGYGHIIRDSQGRFIKIVEHKDSDENERVIKEINTGVYCFKGIELKNALNQLKNNNIQNEYYLTDTIEIIIKNGGSVDAFKAENAEEFFGINTRIQLSNAEKIMRKKVNEYHMLNGVTIIGPENTYIDTDVTIGMDTIIYPGTILEGNTVIGEDCIVGPCSKISNTNISDRVKIQFTTALNSKIGSDTVVGPYAYIRPNSNIGSHVKIGDFVEVKNSIIDDGTKVSHLTYIGDSDVGKNINFGCGTVTVNYDGKKKFRTVIEDNVFIGCNTNLVAPVKVGKGSYIAAGSTITKDIPENNLAVARQRQKNIEGWVKK